MCVWGGGRGAEILLSAWHSSGALLGAARNANTETVLFGGQGSLKPEKQEGAKLTITLWLSLAPALVEWDSLRAR